MNSELDPNQQQVTKNQVVLHNKAQIALDTLPKQEQEKIIVLIRCLEEFPHCSQIQYKALRSIPDYFIAKVGIYRIVFEFKPGKVTIIDIINYERIEILYNSAKKVEA